MINLGKAKPVVQSSHVDVNPQWTQVLLIKLKVDFYWENLRLLIAKMASANHLIDPEKAKMALNL